MENIVERIKNAFSRATDRVAGRYVPIHKEPGHLENLDDRPLSKPAVDIYENDEHVLIRADVPGANPDNTWVQIDEHRALTFYTRNDSVSEQKRRPMTGDAFVTDWYRVFHLPEYLDGDEARATIENGVLSIYLSKRKVPALLFPETLWRFLCEIPDR